MRNKPIRWKFDCSRRSLRAAVKKVCGGGAWFESDGNRCETFTSRKGFRMIWWPSTGNAWIYGDHEFMITHQLDELLNRNPDPQKVAEELIRLSAAVRDGERPDAAVLAA